MLDRVPILEGYRVLAPCVLFSRLGEGGMGAVFRGRHLNLDIEVAVKCMKEQLSGDERDFVSRFHREARVAASVTFLPSATAQSTRPPLATMCSSSRRVPA